VPVGISPVKSLPKSLSSNVPMLNVQVLVVVGLSVDPKVDDDRLYAYTGAVFIPSTASSLVVAFTGVWPLKSVSEVLLPVKSTDFHL